MKDAEFLFHGSIGSKPVYQPDIQLAGQVSGGNLAFDPAWPELEDVNASIRLDNHKLDVQVQTATLLGNRVADTQVSLIDNPHDRGLALRVNGLIQGDTAAAIQLLQNSPVKSAIGDTLDTWVFRGDVGAQVQLIVPLTAEAKGTYQSVDVTFDGAEVDMSDIDLTLSNVRGSLNYSSKNGVTSSGLSANLWDETVTATIDSPFVGKGEGRHQETKIYVNGKVALADISAWAKRPELQFVTGAALVDGEISIPLERREEQTLSLRFNSKLRGVELDLPAPFDKSSDQEEDFFAEVKLYSGYQKMDFRYGNSYQLSLRTGLAPYAHLHLGESNLRRRAKVSKLNRAIRRSRGFSPALALRRKLPSATSITTLPVIVLSSTAFGAPGQWASTKKLADSL